VASVTATDPAPVTVTRGDGPVVLAFPHVGTWLPEALYAGLNAQGRLLTDTDWHVDRLYAGLLPEASAVRAGFHRYVIDANRPADDHSLYPGQATTGLVPLTDFDGQAIWHTPPSAADVSARLRTYHAAYHAALDAELTRVHAAHGVVLLIDCHSIRSVVPRLFDGVLPDLNIGTAQGQSCDPQVAQVTVAHCDAAAPYRWVLNGRFTGGWTTRHYGRPARGMHAIQMEIAQRSYLRTEAAPFAFDAERAAPLRRVLQAWLQALHALAPTLRPDR
jgi:N-formylglutamate deformylase